MPSIGVPKSSSANPFGNIKIGADNKDEDIGTTLNRISGKGERSRFVDRKKHNVMGKDGFLKLLSHQLESQDPFSPMDQKKFASELAQFSQLEQLANINSKMDKNGKQIPMQNKFYAASFMGKNIFTKGATVDYKGESSIILPFHLPKVAQKAIVRIYDQSNNLVRQLEQERVPQGLNSIEWDGKEGSRDGGQVLAGIYRFEVIGFDEKYQKFSGDSKVEGLVTGVEFEGDEAVLLVSGNKRVFLRDVTQFKVPEDEVRTKTVGNLQNMAHGAYNRMVESK